MGARGPAPTPKAELARRGSWRAKKRSDELTVAPGIPDRPAELAGEAAAEWDRLVAVLGPKRVLGGDLDRAALTSLCQAWGEYCELGARLRGRVKKSERYQVWTMREQAWKRWRELAKAFGLSPADRPRVKVTDPQPQQDHGKSKYFQTQPLRLAGA